MTEKQKSKKIHEEERKCGKGDEAKETKEMQKRMKEKKNGNVWEDKASVTSQ